VAANWWVHWDVWKSAATGKTSL